MTPLEKLQYNVVSELDVFITLLRTEGVVIDKNTRDFIRDVVIPRLTTLRIMVSDEVVSGETLK